MCAVFIIFDELKERFVRPICFLIFKFLLLNAFCRLSLVVRIRSLSSGSNLRVTFQNPICGEDSPGLVDDAGNLFAGKRARIEDVLDRLELLLYVFSGFYELSNSSLELRWGCPLSREGCDH